MQLNYSHITSNRQMLKALRRIVNDVDDLKATFRDLTPNAGAKWSIFMVALVDEGADYVRPRLDDPEVYDVEVGYDDQTNFGSLGVGELRRFLSAVSLRAMEACEEMPAEALDAVRAWGKSSMT